MHDEAAARSRAMLEDYLAYGPENCPIRMALGALADDKWKIVVLVELARRGEAHFGVLLRAVNGIRTKALTKSLRALEEAGLVEREVVPGIPTRVAYRLTPRAHAAVPIIVQLHEWAVGAWPELRQAAS